MAPCVHLEEGYEIHSCYRLYQNGFQIQLAGFSSDDILRSIFYIDDKEAVSECYLQFIKKIK